MGRAFDHGASQTPITVRKEDCQSRKVSDYNAVLREFLASQWGVSEPQLPVRGILISWNSPELVLHSAQLPARRGSGEV